MSFDLLRGFRPAPAGSLLAGCSGNESGKNRALDNRPRPRAVFSLERSPYVAIPRSKAARAASSPRSEGSNTPKSHIAQ
ncbi:unnamed protein product, partial [marine sediment metagenome]